MATLNEIVCASADSRNVGFSSCFLDMRTITGAFLVPNGYKVTAVELQDLQAKLIGDAKAVPRSGRIYPIHGFQSITDSTEAKTLQTFAYGAKIVAKEADSDWSFQFTNGGLVLHSALRGFNSNNGWSVLFYDSKFTLLGTDKGDGGLYGIPTKINWADQWKPNTGSDVTVYMVQFVFESRYINENIGTVAAGSYLADILGLQDLAVSLDNFNEATGVAKVFVKTKWGTNLFGTYETEIADVTVWEAFNKATGGAITVTSVTSSTFDKSFIVTLDIADLDYPALAQGISLNLVNASLLDAAGVIGYESMNPLSLVTV